MLDNSDQILIINGLKAERSRCYNDKKKVEAINKLLRKIGLKKWIHNHQTNQVKELEDKPQKFVAMIRVLKKEVSEAERKDLDVQVAKDGRR